MEKGYKTVTNREKFAEQILDIACGGSKIAVDKATLEPIACYKLECKHCLFNTYSYDYCGDKTEKWANSEYVEPPVDWSKVAVDTPILVRNSEEEVWEKRHFAKYENGIVYAWAAELRKIREKKRLKRKPVKKNKLAEICEIAKSKGMSYGQYMAEQYKKEVMIK